MIGLTTIENFLINYKNPKCLAITKDEHNKYSITDVKDWHSFTDINMSPRFYKNNYYNKNNDEFLIPGYEKTIYCKINIHININSEMNLKLIKKDNNGVEDTSIYCLPKFYTDETKLLLEIGG